MKTNRLEAFSDGVIAIIVTIMVLELKVPHDTSSAALFERWPVFLSYVLSFVVVAIMWVNHHHMIHAARRADAALLWSNNHLLFWMSLIPFATAYMGETHGTPLVVAVYGGVLALASMAFTLMRGVIAGQHRDDADSITHHRRVQLKNLLSAGIYAGSVPMAFLSVRVSLAIFCLVPALYFLPERTFEKYSG